MHAAQPVDTPAASPDPIGSDAQEDPADPIAMVQSLFPGRILRIDANETADSETDDGETDDGDDSGAPATREQDPLG